MDDRKGREEEVPTLAFRLKNYKAAMQQLRCIVRLLKDCTTVTFLPKPALVVQTVRPSFVSKITFNSSCLYLTSPAFKAKTINNHLPLIGNFMYLTSSRDLTNLSVQDCSSLSLRFHMAAADYEMDFSSACVHGQELVREPGNSAARVDLESSIVNELIRWIAPHIRPKRNSKKQSTSNTIVQFCLHPSPPTVKFSLVNGSELEFTAGTFVSFHEVKAVRLNVQAKFLHQALSSCAVTKLPCTVRVLADGDVTLYVSSKNTSFCIENFLGEETLLRSDAVYERGGGGYQVAVGGDDFERSERAERGERPERGDRGDRGDRGSAHSLGSDRAEVNVGGDVVVGKKHERPPRKGEDHGNKEKYDQQHKITSFMIAKGGAGGGSGGAGNSERGGYFNDAKEESDSEESFSFDYTPNTKKQKCCA